MACGSNNCICRVRATRLPRRIRRNGLCLPAAPRACPRWWRIRLAGLTGAIQPGATEGVVWGTFYDIRRYGGLQILLRALLGRASLILSDADEEVGDFLARLGRHGVTHLTGTPSHWRRALMSPANAADRAALCAAVGRDRRPGHSGQSEGALSRRADGPCLCLDRGRRGL